MVPIIAVAPAVTFMFNVSTSVTTVEITFLNKEHKERICSPDKETKFDFTDPKGLAHIECPKTEQYALASWLEYLVKEPYSSKQKLFSSVVFNKDGMILTCHRTTTQEIVGQIKKVLSTKFEIAIEEIQEKKS